MYQYLICRMQKDLNLTDCVCLSKGCTSGRGSVRVIYSSTSGSTRMHKVSITSIRQIYNVFSESRKDLMLILDQTLLSTSKFNRWWDVDWNGQEVMLISAVLYRLNEVTLSDSTQTTSPKLFLHNVAASQKWPPSQNRHGVVRWVS